MTTKYIIAALFLIAVLAMSTTNAVMAQPMKPISHYKVTVKTTALKGHKITPFSDVPHSTSFSWGDCNGVVRSGTYYGYLTDEVSSTYNEWDAKWSWPSSEYVGSSCGLQSLNEVDNLFYDDSQNTHTDAGTSSTNPESSYQLYVLNNLVSVGDTVHQEEVGWYGCFFGNCADYVPVDSNTWTAPS